MRHLATLAICLSLAPPLPLAATGCARDAMLVFDGSASMAELGFDTTIPTRIEDARSALRRALPDITALRRGGLLIYGPGGADACAGLKLHFAPVPDAADPIIAALDATTPAGLTPLATAVQSAAETLEYRTTPGIVVLVTDGNETCGGRPCALGDALAREARDLTVHVIGFRVEYDPFAWDSPEAGVFSGGASVAKCLSDRTGGLYVATRTVDELTAALQQTLGCALIGKGRENLTGRAKPG